MKVGIKLKSWHAQIDLKLHKSHPILFSNVCHLWQKHDTRRVDYRKVWSTRGGLLHLLLSSCLMSIWAIWAGLYTCSTETSSHTSAVFVDGVVPRFPQVLTIKMLLRMKVLIIVATLNLSQPHPHILKSINRLHCHIGGVLPWWTPTSPPTLPSTLSQRREMDSSFSTVNFHVLNEVNWIKWLLRWRECRRRRLHVFGP